ncbi:glycosyltransferase family 4 protein [Pontiella sp.]|uniref:glycosyltransferase family 4 protein n=1 Tax=Pontiella sp. TaxID=2837462 RepID=UPI00356B1C8D
MKILFLANRLPYRDVAGGHRLVYQRMRQLKARGHIIGLAAFAAHTDLEHIDELRAELDELETLPPKKQRLWVRVCHDYINRWRPAIFWKNHSRGMMRLVGDMVERTQYDVVIAEYGEMGMYLYRNPYLSAVHKIVSCHRCLTTAFSKYIETPGVPLSLRLKSATQVHILERFEFEMYSAMDHILTLTQEDRFTLLNHAPQLPISVVHPGIDIEFLNRKTRVKPLHTQIMMCGYFADKSNHDAAVWFVEEIWPMVSRNHPHLRCCFVGEGMQPELKRLTDRMDSIYLIDWVDDLRPYRDQAAVFINPVRLGSGLRIKMLEAMASSLPVVTTSLGAASIPAQNGVNCFIADTPELFAQSINWLIDDHKLAAAMGSEAKATVSAQHTIDTAVDELEKILFEVVAS